jgi:hypothetical protein
MPDFKCPYCYDKGYIEWYDRDQDAWYTYRSPCRHCQPDKPQVDHLVDRDVHEHWKPESVFMESQPHPMNGGEL